MRDRTAENLKENVSLSPNVFFQNKIVYQHQEFLLNFTIMLLGMFIFKTRQDNLKFQNLSACRKFISK